jgi:hypothetical protein
MLPQVCYQLLLHVRILTLSHKDTRHEKERRQVHDTRHEKERRHVHKQAKGENQGLVPRQTG